MFSMISVSIKRFSRSLRGAVAIRSRFDAKPSTTLASAQDSWPYGVCGIYITKNFVSVECKDAKVGFI